jgi:hypothetical protein
LCDRRLRDAGGAVLLESPVVRLERDGDRIARVVVKHPKQAFGEPGAIEAE